MQGDIIFERLRQATDVEFRTIARLLDVEVTSDRAANIVDVSRSYRSAAGNSFANVFRDAHALPYRSILETVVKDAESETIWSAHLSDDLKDEWIENYVSLAYAFIDSPDAKTMSEDAKDRVKAVAMDALHGKRKDLGEALADLAKALAPLGLFVYAPLLIVGTPFVVVASIAGPALRKVVPVTLTMIHIRKRIEAQTMLNSTRST